MAWDIALTVSAFVFWFCSVVMLMAFGATIEERDWNAYDDAYFLRVVAFGIIAVALNVAAPALLIYAK